MLYMIDKNMKICKNLKLLENADDHDINNNEKKKKNEIYDFIDYISNNDFDAASASAADFSHAISD